MIRASIFVILITIMTCSLLSHMQSWGSLQFSPWGLMSTSCFTVCPAATANSQTPWKCLPHCSPTWKSAKLCQRPSREVLYRIHTLCCIFSPSMFAPFVPAILEQSFRPPHLLHCIFRQRWKTADLMGNNKGPSPCWGLGLLKDRVGPWHKLYQRLLNLASHWRL